MMFEMKNQELLEDMEKLLLIKESLIKSEKRIRHYEI